MVSRRLGRSYFDLAMLLVIICDVQNYLQNKGNCLFSKVEKKVILNQTETRMVKIAVVVIETAKI